MVLPSPLRIVLRAGAHGPELLDGPLRPQVQRVHPEGRSLAADAPYDALRDLGVSVEKALTTVALHRPTVYPPDAVPHF